MAHFIEHKAMTARGKDALFAARDMFAGAVKVVLAWYALMICERGYAEAGGFV